MSQNHRIIKFGKTTKTTQSNHQPVPALNHVTQCDIYLSVNTLRDGDSVTSLGSLYQTFLSELLVPVAFCGVPLSGLGPHFVLLKSDSRLTLVWHSVEWSLFRLLRSARMIKIHFWHFKIYVFKAHPSLLCISLIK